MATTPGRPLAAAAACLAACAAQGATLRLVDDGRTAYRIVIAADAVEGVKLAAAELQRVIRKATGAQMPIDTLADAKTLTPEQKVIVLGQNAFTRSLGISLAKARPESFVIRTVGRALVIAGHDTAGEAAETGFEAKAGTLIGVYAFLRRHLGARWFVPGELWEVVPAMKTLDVPQQNRLEQPDFLRRDPHRYRGMSKQQARDHALWARRNGCGMGIHGHARHSWRTNIPSKRFQDHPEWFALVGGQRRPYKPVQCCGQICSSHPDVVRIFIDNARRHFDAHPGTDLFSISPNDGRGFCECERCKALDAPGTESLTDRIFTFYEQVAREVGKTHPRKFVGGYAYATYKELPRRIKRLPPNVLLVHVQNNTAFYTPEREAWGLDLMRQWAQFHGTVSFYTFPVGSGFWGLPAVNTDWVRRLLPWLKKHRFLGIKLATLCYAGMQPDLYVYVSLLWDADQDVDKLLDDYYAKAFGRAGPYVRRYHDLLRESWNDNYTQGVAGFRGSRKRQQAVVAVYAPIAAECRKLLDRAMTEAGSDAVRQRVAVLSDNFHLAELLLDIVQTSDKIKAQKPRSRDDLARMLALCKQWHAFVEARRRTHAVDVGSIDKMRAANNILAPERWQKMLE